ANAEVGGHDGGEEDDAQHQPAVEPSLDQEPFQRLVSEASPVLFAHDHSLTRGASPALRRSGGRKSICLAVMVLSSLFTLGLRRRGAKSGGRYNGPWEGQG